MEQISLRYGEGELHATIPDHVSNRILLPGAAANLTKVEQLEMVQEALKQPVGSTNLATLVQGKSKVVVVISDITRLAPSSLMLPLVLGELQRGGLRPEDVTIMIGSGNHRQVTEEEKVRLVGTKVYAEYTCLDVHEGGYTLVGVTARDTPVEVSEYVAAADLTVFTGNIEIHRLAGFSGGVKACIGISSPRAIEANHKLSRLGPFSPGEMADNVVRADLEEYARLLGNAFLLNVVTDEWGNIEAAFSGDLIEAHKKGTVLARDKYLAPLDKEVELVVVSAGGTPKDSSLYQALKAIQNAATVLKDGGIIVAVAFCQEGLGDAKFREWINQGRTVQDIVKRGQKEFVLGGHKAVMLATVLQNARVYLVSQLPERLVAQAGFRHFSSLQDAVDTAIQELSPPELLVIPYGGATVPRIVKESVLVGC